MNCPLRSAETRIRLQLPQHHFNCEESLFLGRSLRLHRVVNPVDPRPAAVLLKRVLEAHFGAGVVPCGILAG